MAEQRAYLVSYDIADPKRLHRVEKVIAGYGFRLQDSVFYCKLSSLVLSLLKNDVSSVMNKDLDQCVIIDLGADVDVINGFMTIGRPLPKMSQIIFV